MRIVICDDERKFVDLLKERISRICLDHEIPFTIDVFYSSEDLIQQLPSLREESRLVVFLDIDMPIVSGFGVANEIQKHHLQCKVVFVTNKDELVYQSYSYHPFFFLRKSHLDFELKRQLLELHRLLKPSWTYLTIEEGKKLIKIPIETIEFVESERNYLILHSEEEKGSPYRLRMKISDAEKKWKQYGFIRAHRGFLVNYNYIDQIGVDHIILISGKTVPVGRNYVTDLRNKILEASDNG